MPSLFTKNGDEILVDLDVYEWAKTHNWCLSAGYPSKRVGGKLEYLHHMLLGKPKRGWHTDHINRNKLDARRENLRHVLPSENSRNTSRHINRTGVSVDRTHGTWKAYLDRPNKTRLNIGTFKTKTEAEQAVAFYKEG